MSYPPTTSNSSATNEDVPGPSGAQYQDALHSYIRNELFSPPKIMIQISGSHKAKHDPEPISGVDFDLWLDFSQDCQLEGIELTENIGMTTYANSSTMETEFNDMLGPWCRRYFSCQTEEMSMVIKREIVSCDEAEILTRLQCLANGVAYGGTLAIQVHLSGVQTLPFSTEPMGGERKFEAKSRWSCRWPLLDTSIGNLHKSLWARRLQDAMVDQIKGQVALSDTPVKLGRSALRRGIAKGGFEVASLESVPTETGDSMKRSTMAYRKWGCDEVDS
ncbi:uncharacterized protein BJX67DRAFT_365817 [Aspergillus lucknowensis]|uniref:Uncharacterized protein n=1 Tax=Aspergillus lucknowensis TaxID=176173 RepID=A0ABR4LDT4_9EURO